MAVVPGGMGLFLIEAIRQLYRTITDPEAERPPPSAERMAVLAIAHHNLAVEQEALRQLRQQEQSVRYHGKISAHPRLSF